MDKRLTFSQIKSFRKCYRRHFMEYMLGLRRAKQADYFRFGGVFHEALDLWGKGCSVDEAIASAATVYDGDLDDETIIERQIVISLLRAYFWRWQEMDSKMEVIASELAFNLPIENPRTGEKHRFSICGKIDKIVRLPDGRLAVMEHKTASDDLDPAGNYFKRLRLDLQISIYTLAAQMMGYPVETVLYDVARKPTTKPKQLTQAQTKHLIETGKYLSKLDGHELVIGAYDVGYQEDNATVLVNYESAEVNKGARGISIAETLDMYGDRVVAEVSSRYDYHFARREIARLESDIQETKLMIWQYATMISSCESRDCWPINDSDCVGFGTCPYFDLCTAGFDPLTEAVVPEGYIIVPDVHQELLN